MYLCVGSMVICVLFGVWFSLFAHWQMMLHFEQGGWEKNKPNWVDVLPQTNQSMVCFHLVVWKLRWLWLPLTKNLRL